MALDVDEVQAKLCSVAIQRGIEANRRSFDSSDHSKSAHQEIATALEAAQAEVTACRQMLTAYETSTSWRITRPLRRAGHALQRFRIVSRPVEPPKLATRLRPLRYDEWVADEEKKVLATLMKPGPGYQPVRPACLGLVLFNGRVPVECPNECSILLLNNQGGVPSVGSESTRMIQKSVPPNFSPAEAVRLALDVLDTEMLCFLDEREELAAEALTLSAKVLAQYPHLDLLFADEDWLAVDGRRERPFFKPGWNAELQRGRDLVGPFAFYRTKLVRAATISAGPAWRYDLANQVAAATSAERIYHIPAVLCHRRSLAPRYSEAMQAAARVQFERDNVAAWVEPVANRPEWVRVHYKLEQPEPLVSVIVPTRDRADLLRICADGVLNCTAYETIELLIVDNGTTDPEALELLDSLAADSRVQVLRRPGAFNWSALNNAAAAQARGTVLLLLNNDIAVLHPDWLATLVGHAMQPGTGAVGAKLLYKDGRVQHAGLTTDQTGIPRHLFRHASANAETAGMFELLGLAREVWGLTGACIAIRRDVFQAVGGLNEALPVAYNDVDLCLRLTALGYRLIWTPWSMLEHRELASRAPDHVGPRRIQVREELNRLLRDWGTLALHDPFLNPNLRLEDELPCLKWAPPPAIHAADALVPAVRDDQVSAMQARRDRARLAAAAAELAMLRAGAAEAGRNRIGRALAPILQTTRAVAAALRSPGSRVNIVDAAPVPSFQGPRARGLALVIDNEWPQPDRDSGSVDITNLVEALVRLGFQTILAAAKQHDGVQPARDRLQELGVRCLEPHDAASVEQFVEQQGAKLDLVVLCRVYCGGAFLELVQEHCRGARLVFNSIDLNFLREERKASVLGDEALQAMLPQIRAREEHVIRSCDATMIVSTAEVDLLGETMPDSLVVQMPLARRVQVPSVSFASRRGIGFIGSFAHAPNVDAVRYLLAEIWPLIARGLPECELTLVGADAPAGLLDGRAERVRMLGHVPDIGPWFESLRLTVAPLRYGAGAKGKVASSLAAGVPCVATSVAAEGMALSKEEGLLVADDPEAFAAATIRAYSDPALWHQLSADGLSYAKSVLSMDEWQARLNRMLLRIGL